MDRGEATEMIISWLTLSIAFSWNLNPYQFLYTLPLSLVAVGTAFLFHELAHRYAANMFGYPARFIMWSEGLLLAIGLAVLTNGRFVFAAPGAVYVFGNPTIRENGIISAVGPLANLIMAIIFYLLAFLTGFPIFYYVAKVNAFIGTFNMLPIYPLDGSKVFAWNLGAYLLLLIPLAVLAFYI